MKLLRVANCQDPKGRYGNWDEALFFGINPVNQGLFHRTRRHKKAHFSCGVSRCLSLAGNPQAKTQPKPLNLLISRSSHAPGPGDLPCARPHPCYRHPYAYLLFNQSEAGIERCREPVEGTKIARAAERCGSGLGRWMRCGLRVRRWVAMTRRPDSIRRVADCRGAAVLEAGGDAVPGDAGQGGGGAGPVPVFRSRSSTGAVMPGLWRGARLVGVRVDRLLLLSPEDPG